MKKNKKAETNAAMNVILNGNKHDLDESTVACQWYFNQEAIERVPTHVVVVEQTEEEANDTEKKWYGGRRYFYKVENGTQFIQFYKPGVHKLLFLVFSSGTTERELSRFKERGGNNYEVYSRYIKLNDEGQVEISRHEVEPEQLIATCVKEVMIPEELFAIKPKGFWGNLVWQWVNWPYETQPRDQCVYRKRAFFAFTIMLVLGILYCIFKALVVLFFVIARCMLFLFGFRPAPIFDEIKDYITGSSNISDLDLRYQTYCGDLGYKEWNWDYIENYSSKRYKRFPICLTDVALIALLYGIIKFYKIASTVPNPSNPDLIVIQLFACIIGFIAFLSLLKGTPLYNGFMDTFKSKDKKPKEDKEDIEKRTYLAYLGGMALTKIPAKIDVDNVQPSYRYRTIHKFYVQFNFLKAKICKSFPSN